MRPRHSLLTVCPLRAPTVLALALGAGLVAATRAHADEPVAVSNTTDAALDAMDRATARIPPAQKLLASRPIFVLKPESHSVMVVGGNATDLGLSGKIQIGLSDPVIADPKFPGRYAITASHVDLIIPLTESASVELSRWKLNMAQSSSGWLNSDATLQLDLYLVAPDGKALTMPIQLGGILRNNELEAIGCLPPNSDGNDMCLFINAAVGKSVDPKTPPQDPTGAPILVNCDGPVTAFTLDQSHSSMSMSLFMGTLDYSLSGHIDLTMGQAPTCVRVADIQLTAIENAATEQPSDDATLNVMDPIAIMITANPTLPSTAAYDAMTGAIEIDLNLIVNDGHMTAQSMHLVGSLSNGHLSLAGDNGNVTDASVQMMINADAARAVAPFRAKAMSAASKDATALPMPIGD